MNGYVIQPRCSTMEPVGRNRISKLFAQIFLRSDRPVTDRLSDHLLRDAGLQRIGGRIAPRRR